MALTYVAIATVTVGSGGAASIDFQNIPGTYTDLLLKLSLRDNASLNSQISYLRFNSDSGNNYSWRRVRGDGSGAASASASSTAQIYAFYDNSANDTASTFANAEIYIPNYAGSNNKSVSSDTVSENNATEAYAGLIAGLWSSASAITRIDLYPNTGSFVQYSTATLYGIKNTV